MGIKAISWIAFTKFHPEAKSPVIKPAVKDQLITTVAVVEEATSNFSASSISWSVYSDGDSTSLISISSDVAAIRFSATSSRLLFSSTLIVVP